MLSEGRGKMASRNTLKKVLFCCSNSDLAPFCIFAFGEFENTKKTQLRRQSTLLSSKQEIVESSVCFIIMLNYRAYLVSKGGCRAWFFIQEI